VLLNSKVIDYVNFILRASEFHSCSAEKVRMIDDDDDDDDDQ